MNSETPDDIGALVSAAPNAADLLQSIYQRPQPYTSVYLQTQPWPAGQPQPSDYEYRWRRLRLELAEQGAPFRSLAAIDSRLAFPLPKEMAGLGVIAASDGHTIVDHALEPPRVDFASVDTLPYAAPLLEWDQRRIPHLVVTIDETGADIVTFGSASRSTIASTTMIGSSQQLADEIRSRAMAIDARLVVIAGDDDARSPLARSLGRQVDPTTRIVIDESADVDELADATVRHVIDTAARTTVDYLREFRFLASHDAASHGTADTISAIADGRVDVLLVTDDPADQRRCWIGDDPSALSMERRPGLHSQARIVDAAIRSAIAQGVRVHIISSTGPRGRSGNIAGLDRS